MIGDTLKVPKLGPEGTPKIEYSGAIRERDERSISIDTGWSREELELGYVTFKPDDRWVETFYLDRWYNIFRIAGADGRLKGFYCNLSRPPVLGNGVLTWQDMAIDV